MAVTRQPSLAFGLMAVTHEPLELGMQNLVRKVNVHA